MSLRALIRPALPTAALLLLALPPGASAAPYASRSLSIGSHGRDVKRLQAYLGSAGHRVARDGDFGPRTTREQRAIKLAVRVAGTGGAAYTPPPPPEQVVAGEDGRVNDDGFAVPPRSAPKVVKEVVAAGNEIAKTPYKWGGGHPRWNDTGYDCSGSVSFALHGAGLLDSPLVSGDFARWGDRGEGNWITIYANADHVYMVVAGMRFDTSARSRTGSRWTMEQRPSEGFAPTHPDGL